MTKFNDRTLDGIKKQLEMSLKRLQLDSFDLMQFHSIGDRDNDVDLIYNNGLLEWAEDQRSQGVFKYIGFTGHADPKALREMIERGFPWDTIQMVLNPGDHHRTVSYEDHVLPLAVEKNMGVIGMKSNGFGRLSRSGLGTAADGLRYAMSLPVSTVVSGIDSLEILEENLRVFHHFIPMSDQENSALLARFEGKSDVIETHRRKFYHDQKS
jgi:predicted aldo/keto reductase-like oxidoreductase